MAEKYAGGGGIAAGDFPVSIVFLQVGNPVGSGFVASLAHPGGNLTGLTNFEPTMGGKWLQFCSRRSRPPVTLPRHRYLQSRHPFRPVLSKRWRRLRHRWPWNSSGARFAMVAGIESAVADLAPEPNGGVVVMPDALASHTPRAHRCAHSPPSLAVDLSVPRFSP